MARPSALISSQNHVEVPFIIVKIGDYTFGHCDKAYKNSLQTRFSITYPNYLDSLSIVKINGAINTYTISMIYAITENDDPNRLEKVFSSVANSRMLTLSYGDWNAPEYMFKNEEAIITSVKTQVNMVNSTISYTIQCTSTSLTLKAATLDFSARYEKPSTVIIELLNDVNLGLRDIFKGMSKTNVDLGNFIARDDQKVQIEAKTAINVLEYISYLVSCMVFEGDDASKNIKTSCYFWSVYDDTTSIYGGTYFKVVRVQVNSNTLVSYNTYEIDIGYPSATNVVDFTINNDDSWALLYDYGSKIDMPQYDYYIDNKGNMLKELSSTTTRSRTTFAPNPAAKNWWSLVTQFPITARLTIKGLLRPAMLMSYVKLNVYFYGHKHTSSGLYIITKQEDQINRAGYRTTLSLTRIGGDEHYA